MYVIEFAWNINWKFGLAAFPSNGLLISSIILRDFCRGISVLDRFVCLLFVVYNVRSNNDL